jgi:hypothetical protein
MTVVDSVESGGGGGRGEENHDILDVLDVANDFSERANSPPNPNGRRFPVVFDK